MNSGESSLLIDEMETLLLKFCKYALYVPTTCSNMAVLGELGRCPFHMSSAVELSSSSSDVKQEMYLC